MVTKINLQIAVFRRETRKSQPLAGISQPLMKISQPLMKKCRLLARISRLLK
jgi:hypothetical protein